MTDFPDLKLKALVSFPAAVHGGTGIDVVKQNGSYQFNLDFGDFAPPVAGLSNPTHQNALLWNDTTGQYVLVPASLLTSGGVTPASAVPLIESGAGAIGASLDYARADHVHPVFSGGGLPVFNVRDYGATGTGSAHADDVAINLALTAIRAAGGGVLWFPYPSANYWVTSAIDVRATSNLVIDGDPGTVIKCSSAFDASNNFLKSSVISGLNFTGTMPPTGYAYRNITISRNIIIDASNQNVGGLPAPAIGGFGFNMASVELMNVDYVSVYCKTLGAFGNGPCISTHDPRLTAPSIVSSVLNAFGTNYAVGDIFKMNGGTFFAGSEATFQVTAIGAGGSITGYVLVSRGIYIALPATNVTTTAVSGIGSGAQIQVTSQIVSNGIRNPVIDCEIINTCRGLLPSYASGPDPGGITGSGFQIGAATDIRVNVRLAGVGGPAGDIFNADGGTWYTYVDSVSATPIGSTQARGSIHSDFGMRNIRIGGRAPSADLRGAMNSGTGYFFNGGVATPGPTNCIFDNFVIDGSIAPDTVTPGFRLMGGSVAGVIGNAKGNKGRIIIENANSVGADLYDVSHDNDLDFVVHEPGQAAGLYIAVRLNAQINQAGGGCSNNVFRLASRDTRGLLINNVKDDATGLHNGNLFFLNEQAAASGATITLPIGSYAVAQANSIVSTVTSVSLVTLTAQSATTQVFTGGIAQTVQLPVAATLDLGHTFLFVNDSSNTLTVNSSGSNVVMLMAANTSGWVQTVLASGTTAASWTFRYFAALIFGGKKLTVQNTLTLAAPDNTTLDFGGWTAYTPTVSATSGAFTTVSATGRYKQFGKTIYLQADVTMTAIGTAATNLQISLPFTAASFVYVGIAREHTLTGKSGAAIIQPGGSIAIAIDSTGTSFIANGAAVAYGITYEIP